MIDEIIARRRSREKARLKEEVRLRRKALEYEGIDPFNDDQDVEFCKCNPFARRLAAVRSGGLTKAEADRIAREERGYG